KARSSSSHPALSLIREAVVVLAQERGCGLTEDAGWGVGRLATGERAHTIGPFFERLDGLGEREPPHRAFGHWRGALATEEAEGGSRVLLLRTGRHEAASLRVERGLEGLRDPAELLGHLPERIVLSERDGS